MPGKFITPSLDSPAERIAVWYGKQSTRRLAWLLFFAVLLLTLPWLGLTEFNTKGEPREAVVSLSMLRSGDWVLPVNNDADIPYKPMLFHWIGAVASLPAGQVSEWTARLPSALALAMLTATTFAFFRRRKEEGSTEFAPLLTAGLLFTCFEVHRAGMNARVDMVLTAFMVAGFYLLYRWWEGRAEGAASRRGKGIPWLAILCMSAAMLTKGPVGILLPCLACGLFMLIRGERFILTFLWMVLFGLLSLILPLLWYWAAWEQGGDRFLELVMEENFGRMTGTMTYDSHVNPWYYNFWITLVGYLPWTLLALFGLFTLRRQNASSRKREWKIGERMHRLTVWSRQAEAKEVFALVSLCVVMFFFCIPSSKRSVYLLPAYPFIGWFAARWFLSLARSGAKAIRAFGSVVASVGILLEVLLVILSLFPVTVIMVMGEKPKTYALMDALASPGILCWLLTGLFFALSAVWFAWRGKLRHGVRMLGWECIMLTGLFLALDGGLQPAVLNTKSLKSEAEEVARLLDETGLPIYQFNSFGESTASNPYHLFELDFYLDDRLGNFLKRKPAEGLLAMPTVDVPEWLPRFEREGYRFEKLHTIAPAGRKEHLEIYRFHRAAATSAKGAGGGKEK